MLRPRWREAGRGRCPGCRRFRGRADDLQRWHDFREVRPRRMLRSWWCREGGRCRSDSRRRSGRGRCSGCSCRRPRTCGQVGSGRRGSRRVEIRAYANCVRQRSGRCDSEVQRRHVLACENAHRRLLASRRRRRLADTSEVRIAVVNLSGPRAAIVYAMAALFYSVSIFASCGQMFSSSLGCPSTFGWRPSACIRLPLSATSLSRNGTSGILKYLLTSSYTA